MAGKRPDWLIIVGLCFFAIIGGILGFFLGNRRKPRTILVTSIRKNLGVAEASPRTVTVSRLHPEAPVFLVKQLLDASECQKLIEMADPRLERSTVVKEQSSGKSFLTVSAERTSFTTTLQKSETPLVQVLEERAALVAGVHHDYLEPLQVVRYTPGQEYKPHYDYFKDSEARQGGQRILTLFVYLNNSDSNGGNTAFPKLGLKVKPSMGCAVMFWNVKPDGNVDTRMLHAGEPVVSGVKYGLNVWFRTKPWVLGKRSRSES